jgi:hypothetical protein
MSSKTADINHHGTAGGSLVRQGAHYNDDVLTKMVEVTVSRDAGRNLPNGTNRRTLRNSAGKDLKISNV